jgi:hypothetical protein
MSPALALWNALAVSAKKVPGDSAGARRLCAAATMKIEDFP